MAATELRGLAMADHLPGVADLLWREFRLATEFHTSPLAGR
jgi:hypothetical protein